jgi:hypothetical protein
MIDAIFISREFMTSKIPKIKKQLNLKIIVNGNKNLTYINFTRNQY